MTDWNQLPIAYQRILTALRHTPGMSREEIARTAFVAATTLSGGGYLRSLKQSGLIFFSGWRRSNSGAFSIPLFSLGNDQDCQRPAITQENRMALGMQKVLEAIEAYGPIDFREAANLAGLSANTLKNAGYLDALVVQERIHISGWRRAQNGHPRAVYEFGPGQSVPKPKPYTAAEKSRIFRKRHAPQQSVILELLKI